MFDIPKHPPRADRAPARDPRGRRRALRAARLPADRARDRRGRRTHLVVDGARAPREPRAPRPSAPRSDQAARARHRRPLDEGRRPRRSTAGIRMLPLLGQIAAGAPTLAEQHVEEEIAGARDADGVGRELPAAGARRVDDRRRHPRRRLRRDPPPETAETARSSPRSSTARRRRSSTWPRGRSHALQPANASMAPIYAETSRCSARSSASSGGSRRPRCTLSPSHTRPSPA